MESTLSWMKKYEMRNRTIKRKIYNKNNKINSIKRKNIKERDKKEKKELKNRKICTLDDYLPKPKQNELFDEYFSPEDFKLLTMQWFIKNKIETQSNA